jgi:hypothetical protein
VVAGPEGGATDAPGTSTRSSGSGTSPASGDGSTADTESSTPQSDGAAEDSTAVNLFPDLDVVRVDDGSPLNLAAELGGGDRPVLLWFWAPH